jgi:hypothetical protein
VLCQSRLSANDKDDKDDNEIISGTVQRSLDVYLTQEENPENP